MFYIKPYGLIIHEKILLLINDSISVKITEDNMINFLSDFGTHGEKSFEIEKDVLLSLLDSFGINKDRGVAFLKKVGIAEPFTKKSKSSYESIIFISDALPFCEGFINSLKSDGLKNIKLLSPENSEEIIEKKENNLFIFYLENYKKEYIKKYYNFNRLTINNSFIQSYYFKSKFIIDGLYSPALGSPCHFCHFGRWQNREKNSFSENQNSWLNVINYLSENDRPIPPSMPLNETDRQYALHILRRKVQMIAGVPVTRVHLSEFSSSVTADLVRCNIHSEPVPHWSACGCTHREFSNE